MKTRNTYLVLGLACSSIMFGLFQNCSQQNFQSGEMLSLMSTSNSLQYTTDEDTPLNETLPQASNYTGSASTVAITSSTKHGDIVITNPQTGAFTYTPYRGFYGTDSFEYSENGSSANVIKNKPVSILVNPVNGIARLDTDLINTDMNTPKGFPLIAKNKYTVPSVILERTGKTTVNTSNGKLTMVSPNNFIYTPNAYFRGLDSYEFTIKDGSTFTTKKVTLSVGNPFHGIQPAMAVRGMGCISCHANVDSTLITDFGRGSGYGLESNRNPFAPESAAHRYYTEDYTGALTSSWDSAKFSTQIIVPNVPLGFDPKATAAAYSSDATFLSRLQFQLSSTSTLQQYIQAVEQTKKSSTPVVAKSQVYIGAPNASTILNKAGMQPTDTMKFLKNSSLYSPEIQGIAGAGQYYKNTSSTIVCDGDLVVNGTLSLSNITVRTDDGCRIMATGGIFLQGPVNYERITTTRPDNNANLQLVSAKFISLGIGRNNCENDSNPGWYNQNSGTRAMSPFAHRFQTYVTYTRETGFNSTNLTSLQNYALAEAAKITELQDASCRGGANPRAVHFERLLLNAPRIDSRYTGQFNGVIIAEAALFSLSNFSFKYDNVFDRVPVLPILDPASFLMVK